RNSMVRAARLRKFERTSIAFFTDCQSSVTSCSTVPFKVLSFITPSPPMAPVNNSNMPNPTIRRVRTFISEIFTITPSLKPSRTGPRSCRPLRWLALAFPALEPGDHARDVEDQRHSPVAEHGGARQAEHRAEIRFET